MSELDLVRLGREALEAGDRAAREHREAALAEIQIGHESRPAMDYRVNFNETGYATLSVTFRIPMSEAQLAAYGERAAQAPSAAVDRVQALAPEVLFELLHPRKKRAA